ncbi:MAG: hypothetical protein FWD55_01790, partial [Propionibacteriaceae bacterium]|nr:hypothetical protein [Propionibacteriaceae bacterium]
QVATQPTPVLDTWASAMTMAHISVYARGLIPESAFTTIEMSALDGRITYRSWPIQAECLCQS